MAAVDEINLTKVAQSPYVDEAKKLLNKEMWLWFSKNQNMKVVALKWGFFRKTFYVRDIEPVFELLFGAPNY